MTPPDAPDAPTVEQIRAWIALSRKAAPSADEYIELARTAVPRLGRALLEALEIIAAWTREFEAAYLPDDSKFVPSDDEAELWRRARAFLASGPPGRLEAPGQ